MVVVFTYVHELMKEPTIEDKRQYEKLYLNKIRLYELCYKSKHHYHLPPLHVLQAPKIQKK